MKQELQQLRLLTLSVYLYPMPFILRYGADSSVQLNLSETVLVAECGKPHGLALDAPGAAVAQCLASPLDYPPLASSVTPADRVVLVLEPGLPQIETITAQVIRCLIDAGLAADGLSIVWTAEDAECGVADPRQLLPADICQRVRASVHDPTDRQKLAYLTATSQGQPVLLNRALTDADVVIPVGRLRNPGSPGYYGVNGVVFPTFADRKTQSRFRSLPPSQSSKPHQDHLIQECDEVGWLLGVTFTIQVVPGPGDAILQVLAGQVQSVAAEGQKRYQDAWRCTVPRQARLVVAAVEGGPMQQTWENVGTALETAGVLVEEGGAIAICCDLAVAPGPGIQRLRGARSRRHAVREICKYRPNDFLPATQIARALDRADVFLLSRLDPSMVEDLEISPLAEPQELVRLTQRYPSCILMSNAAHAMVVMQDDG